MGAVAGRKLWKANESMCSFHMRGDLRAHVVHIPLCIPFSEEPNEIKLTSAAHHLYELRLLVLSRRSASSSLQGSSCTGLAPCLRWETLSRKPGEPGPVVMMCASAAGVKELQCTADVRWLTGAAAAAERSMSRISRRERMRRAGAVQLTRWE